MICPKCGCKDVDVLSCGTILCHNPQCLTISSKDTPEGE
jgi:hypothetical protein